MRTGEVLVLSEVGVQARSQYEGRVLFQIIDQRYRDRRPFLLASNLTVEELVSVVDPDGSPRIMDRLGDIAQAIPFTWGSRRQKGRRA